VAQDDSAVQSVRDSGCGNLCGAGGEESDVEAGKYDERSAEDHRESWHLVKQEERDDGTSYQLGVVVLGDVRRCRVAERNEEADASGGAECAHDDEREK